MARKKLTWRVVKHSASASQPSVREGRGRGDLEDTVRAMITGLLPRDQLVIELLSLDGGPSRRPGET
jgi:hypothetical protein